MYSNYVIGFGIGWCLAYIITVFLVSGKAKSVTSAVGGISIKIKDDISQLLANINGLRKEYTDSRWDQVKKLGNDFSRNPKAFKYDFDSLIQGPESRAKTLDDQMKDVLQKCNNLISEYDKSMKTSTKQASGGDDSKGGPMKVVNIIGITGIIIANLLIFVLKF
jgi:hypothetical protein